MSPEPDIHEIARRQAVLEQRVGDHDTVLVDIRAHLAEIVGEFGKFRLSACVFFATVFAGSPTGHDLIGRLLG